MTVYANQQMKFGVEEHTMCSPSHAIFTLIGTGATKFKILT